jgi:hypothetical protein
MHNIFRSNFRYIAQRYEEWQGGVCINKGLIDAEIIAEVIDEETIRFKIEDADNLNILKDFEFELLNPMSESLPDRIQYIHSTNDFNPIVPIVCHIFHKDNNIEYVRFAMTNPDRIIEFYGNVVEMSQPHRLSPKEQEDYHGTTADSILSELRSYGMYESGAIMERAAQLFWDNAKVENKEQVRLIIESHKLFVEVYKIAQEEKDYSDEENDSEPMILPKVYLFMAYCNYKIGNIKDSYLIAKMAEHSLEEVLRTSLFTGIRDMVGGKDIDEFLDILKNQYGDEISTISEETIDPCKLDLDLLRKNEVLNGDESGKPNKAQIKSLIEAINEIKENILQYADSSHNNELVMRAFQFSKMLELYTYPLLYAWQIYKYGWHSDFWEEGESMLDYMMFELKSREMTKQLLDTLEQGDSPFKNFERNGAITKDLIRIYSILIKDNSFET